MTASVDWKVILVDLASVYEVLLTRGVRATCKALWGLWAAGPGKWDRLSYLITCECTGPTASSLFKWDRVRLLYNMESTEWLYYASITRWSDIHMREVVYDYEVTYNDMGSCCLYSMKKHNGNDGVTMKLLPYPIYSMYNDTEHLYSALSSCLDVLIAVKYDDGRRVLYLHKSVKYLSMGTDRHKKVIVCGSVLMGLLKYLFNDRLDIVEFLTRHGLQ